MSWVPEALAEHVSTRAERVALDGGWSVAEVLLALRDDRHPFALVGNWAGGGALLGSEPLAVVEGAAATFDVLAQPGLAGAPPGVVGGGWFGHLGFGLAHEVESLPPSPPRPVPRSRGRLAFHDHVLRLDSGGRWWFEALVTDERRGALGRRLDELRRRLATPAAPRPWSLDRLVPRAPGWAGHRAAVAEGVERIAAGEIFQANLCMRFEGSLSGAAIDTFAAASAELRPDYGAYFETGDGALMGFSPELFLRRAGRRVETAPIKGTALRSEEAGAAEAQRAALAASGKDAAEHVMIVDLMRNDLGRVCLTGSVVAPDAPDVEAHPGIWHLVSRVYGDLGPGATDADLLRATFPPGSVTGAPKVQALKVISELEATAREAYTGAMGYTSPVTGLELNVAIRTLEVAGSEVWLGVGGGIVADSDPGEEALEVWRKAAPLARALRVELAPPPAPAAPAASITPLGGPRPDPALGVLETLAVREGTAVALDSHLDRLRASVALTYGMELPTDLADRVAAVAAGGGGPPARLRVVAIPHGARLDVDVMLHDVEPAPPDAVVELVARRLAGGLGAHKWADRRLVDAASADGSTPLLVDLDGQVLEAGWANVWVVEGEALVTPPADGRLLPGVTRGLLLARAGAAGFAASEDAITLERVARADVVLLTSSVALATAAALGARRPGPHAVEVVRSLRDVLLRNGLYFE